MSSWGKHLKDSQNGRWRNTRESGWLTHSEDKRNGESSAGSQLTWRTTSHGYHQWFAPNRFGEPREPSTSHACRTAATRCLRDSAGSPKLQLAN